MIHKLNYGYLDTSLSSAIAVAVAVSSATPNTGNLNGGIEVTLVGTGFPTEYKSGLTVTVGSSTVSHFKSVSNLQIVFVLPPMQAPDTDGSSV